MGSFVDDTKGMEQVGKGEMEGLGGWWGGGGGECKEEESELDVNNLGESMQAPFLLLPNKC